jgi:amino acid transporter
MLFIDWGRWIIMLLTVQFMLVFYFLHTQEVAVVYTANKFTTIVQKNMFAAVLFIMLSVFFGPISYFDPSENFKNLLEIPAGIIKNIGN